jgi:hypothetical protein
MEGISHSSAAWSEVSKSYMNGVWCKLWPDRILVLQDHVIALASITEIVTDVAKEIGLDDVQVGDINELLESSCEVFRRKIKYYTILNRQIAYKMLKYFVLIIENLETEPNLLIFT